MTDSTASLTYAFGAPGVRARLRVRPEDFQVEERLRFAPDGEGTHAFLKIRKRGMNTRDVARMLARHAGVRPLSVGYAGMKDRHAVTAQWFSADLSGRSEPDWRALESDDFEIMEIARHARKLRPGQLKENGFRVTLRGIEGDRQALEARLERMAAEGVPNYFGPQRFGRGGANLDAAARMFDQALKVRDRRLRGLYLSAARAQVFNRLLCARVDAGLWNRALPGDILMFDDSRSRFSLEAGDGLDDPRIAGLELHPTGPLWGCGSPETSGEAADLERRVAAVEGRLAAGLEAAGLEADRRALRLRVRAMEYAPADADALEVKFSLRPGAYATAVLREAALTADP